MERDFDFMIGAYRCSLLFDSILLVRPEAVLPVAMRDRWPPLTLDADGRIVTPVFAVLLELGGRRILVDTGNGERPDRPASNQGTLPNRLRQRGIRPEDIDTVVLTHSHLDHVGGSLTARRQDAPLTYPRARHVLTRPEWEYASAAVGDTTTVGALAARETLSTLHAAGALELVTADAEVAPGLRLVPAPGHTPGNVVVTLTSDGEEVVFLGDSFHHPGQIEHPELVAPGDHDKALVPMTRRGIISRAMSVTSLVVAAHFPFPAVGRIVPRPDARDGDALDGSTFVPVSVGMRS